MTENLSLVGLATNPPAVVDAQGKRDFAMAHTQLRVAAAHVQMIATRWRER